MGCIARLCRRWWAALAQRQHYSSCRSGRAQGWKVAVGSLWKGKHEEACALVLSIRDLLRYACLEVPVVSVVVAGAAVKAGAGVLGVTGSSLAFVGVATASVEGGSPALSEAAGASASGGEPASGGDFE